MTSHKLNLAQILAIRLDERPHHLIAADYGISRPYVCQIKRGARLVAQLRHPPHIDHHRQHAVRHH